MERIASLTIFLSFIADLIISARAITPYTPASGGVYYFEAAREGTWPSCQYRFLSYPGTCDSVDLWNAAGVNQQWTLVSTGEDNTYYLRSSCGQYLSYSGDCNSHVVDMWPEAGINQKFRLVAGYSQFEYFLEAIGRSSCEFRWASFPVPCSTSSPDDIDLWNAAGPDQTFRIHPVSQSPALTMDPIANSGCADPFVWYSTTSAQYVLHCTGGGLPISYSASIAPTSVSFTYQGNALGGTAPDWAANPGGRWAPESFHATSDESQNYLFFSDSSDASGGKERIGWALSTAGKPNPGSWDQYSTSWLDLGGTSGGEIDATVFKDDDGSTYLLWKSDDNNVGSTTTRIWAQQVSFGNSSVTQLGSPAVVMDSTGMWWVDSWVAGGTLVEGPEVVKHGGYYYLFFASGKYCQNSYAEGVARSAAGIWGPYEKMSVPFLSTGIVGVSPANGNKKLIGPGHAGLVRDAANGTDQWYAVFHASLDDQCNRMPFIAAVEFGSSGWPVAQF